MMLVDSEIKTMVEEKNLITSFDESKLSSISYDVSIDKFIINNEEKEFSEYVLPSLDYIYVKIKEGLNMPNDLCCMVVEKNSLMRKGLKVDGPLYQPGHNTNVYIRVFNMNKESILLEGNMKIAQLSFIKLNCIPNVTYDKQIGACYNNEKKFIN